MNGLLIVDDEEGVRRAVQKAMGKENYVVFTAPNGSEAIRIVKDHPAEIAVCISDFKMPGLDGLQTLAAIGSINPEITRIMLTGYATLEGAIAATNEGIDGFLTKPFDNVELRAKVREYFVRKRLKQFVSPQVLQQLQADPSYLMPRKQLATLLFVDIRGFTALTEKHDPQQWAHVPERQLFQPAGRDRLSEQRHAGQAHRRRHHGDLWRADCRRRRCAARGALGGGDARQDAGDQRAARSGLIDCRSRLASTAAKWWWACSARRASENTRPWGTRSTSRRGSSRWPPQIRF